MRKLKLIMKQSQIASLVLTEMFHSRYVNNVEEISGKKVILLVTMKLQLY